MSKKPKPTPTLRRTAKPLEGWVADGTPEQAFLDPQPRGKPRLQPRSLGPAMAKRSIYLSLPTDAALERFCGQGRRPSAVVEAALVEYIRDQESLRERAEQLRARERNT